MAMAGHRNEEANWETILKSIFEQLDPLVVCAKTKIHIISKEFGKKVEQLNIMMIRWRKEYGVTEPEKKPNYLYNFQFDKHWEVIDTHVKHFLKISSARSHSEKRTLSIHYSTLCTLKQVSIPTGSVFLINHCSRLSLS